MKKRILSFLLALCMCLTLVPVTVLADDDVQQINDAAVQAITPGSDVSVLSVVPDTGAYHTYEFYVDSEKIDTQIVKNGDTLYKPPITAPAGKTFTGWNPNVTFGTVFNVDKTETIRVDAQFEDGYHVYFKDNNGRIIATKTGETGKSISVADVNFPVGSDEAITGWYTDAGQKVESVIIGNADITLYAKVEKGYWLTFESNGGSYVAPAFYANGTPAAAPDEPAKSGYTFAGWFTDKELTQTADFSSITAPATLYAKWTEKGNTSYTVIHWLENADDDGYSYKASETKTGTTGDTTNATAKNYDGFTAQTITQETIKGDGSTIVSVKYKRNVYFVKFFTDRKGKNEDTSKRITAKYGANIRKQWPGGSWYVNKSGSTAQTCIDTMPLNGKNFYGKQQGTSSTGHYYIEVLPGQDYTETRGSKHYALDHSDSAPWGVSVTKEDRYDMTGFTCNEQYSTKDGRSYNGAKFFYDRNSYNIVFVSNGSDEHTVSKKFEQSIADVNYTPKALTGEKSDYVFAGWYASQECTGEAYDFTGKTMPANNITLYAKWVAPTYTVTVYDQNGNYLGKTTVSKGDTVTDWLSTQKNKITLDTGDSFLGWTINRGLPFYPGTKITTNYELYAKVGNSTGYSVTYNANGGTGSVTDTEKYAKGAEATVMSNSFINDGKVFLSWNTQANGTGTTYYPNSTVKITGDVTLYAQWGDKASTVSVTYHSNFGTDQTKTVNGIANNGQITVADYSATGLSAREGYTFAGWKNNEGISFSANDPARVDNGSNDLYAQWTINQYNYTVEYYIDNVKNDSMTVTGNADFGSVINSYTDKCPTGYALEKTENLPLTIGVNESENVIKVFYKKNVFNLTIHYVYAEGGTAAEDHTDSVTFNDTYSVTSPTINGYTADTTVVSGTMPAENVEVTVTYTKRTDLSYTVHYYWNGTTESVAPDKTVPGQSFNASVTESPVAVTGCTPVNTDSKAITIGTGKNEITFYYYKNVELTANSKTETYDGTEKSVSGYTGAPEGVTFNGISASGSGTDVGEYNVIFDGTPVGKVDTTNKYIVTETTPGKLTIKPVEVTVTIKGNTKTETYDGTEYTVTGYTIESISNDLYSADNVTLKDGAKAEAKGTNAGDYMMGLTKESFENKNTNFKVTFVVEDGKLTIKPAEVTVTIKGNTKTETYAGTEYTVTGYTVESISNNLYKEEYFALKTDAKVEAKGTNAGDYMMGLTKESFENKNTNFKVTFEVEDGKLTIAKRDVTVTGESATKVYNGQTQEINGYTVDNLVKGHEMTGVTYSAKGKDPGKYDGSFTGSQIVIKDADGNDVTKNYNVKPVIGVLTITQPSRPTRPSTPTKDVTSVKTADGSQMTLWMSMMLASAAGIVFLGKKRKEEQ